MKSAVDKNKPPSDKRQGETSKPLPTSKPTPLTNTDIQQLNHTPPELPAGFFDDAKADATHHGFTPQELKFVLSFQMIALLSQYLKEASRYRRSRSEKKRKGGAASNSGNVRAGLLSTST